MEAVKFTLSGDNAFFKKPEVNTYYYFTYGHIHKIALLGMFGAILGYNGYANKKWRDTKSTELLTEEYPEFYEKLRDISISIVPENEKAYIPKKMQVFNNSVGYASMEQGGNLIVKEQWLEHPVWTIYVKLDCEEAKKIAKHLLEQTCVYIPYLGKNDHPASIKDVEIVTLEENQKEEMQIASLFPKKFGMAADEFNRGIALESFKYEEKLPIRMDGYTNQYELETLICTNLFMKISEAVVYKDKHKNLIFI